MFTVLITTLVTKSIVNLENSTMRILQLSTSILLSHDKQSLLTVIKAILYYRLVQLIMARFPILLEMGTLHDKLAEIDEANYLDVLDRPIASQLLKIRNKTKGKTKYSYHLLVEAGRRGMRVTVASTLELLELYDIANQLVTPQELFYPINKDELNFPEHPVWPEEDISVGEEEIDEE